MVLGRGFESQLDGKDGPLDGRKTNKKKDSQMGQVTPKKTLALFFFFVFAV